MADKFRGSTSRFTTESSKEMFTNWVKKKSFIYIGEKPIVDHLMYDDYMSITDPKIQEADKCKYVLTDFPLLTRPRAFAYSKSFRFHELFDTT